MMSVNDQIGLGQNRFIALPAFIPAGLSLWVPTGQSSFSSTPPPPPELKSVCVDGGGGLISTRIYDGRSCSSPPCSHQAVWVCQSCSLISPRPPSHSFGAPSVQ
ncbi:UNVERIFIED_CONTAM: hypothetical protein K2H54_036974 [Gekko kuhli]